MLLAGDVGGTNARFALFARDGSTRVRQQTLRSADFPSLEVALTTFLEQAGGAGREVEAAAIGVAGPVIDQRCEMPNLPWKLDARLVSHELGIPRIELVNDLVALALGAIGLPKDKLARIHGEHDVGYVPGNIAMIAAGTGLGEALLVWDGHRYVPTATEGGHTDFAPRNEVEIELLRFLQARIGGRVSFERILSGPGIGHLYDFALTKLGIPESPDVEAAVANAKDRNRAIAEQAATGSSHAARRAIDLFLDVYGSEAGNLALKTFAVGGVFVAGGIAASLVDRLPQSTFVPSFLAKGRMSRLLQSVPVAVVLDSDIGLEGAARHAKSLLL